MRSPIANAVRADLEDIILRRAPKKVELVTAIRRETKLDYTLRRNAINKKIRTAYHGIQVRSSRLTFLYKPDDIRLACGPMPHVVPGPEPKIIERDVLPAMAMAAIIGCCETTFGNWVRGGDFPAPIGYVPQGGRKFGYYTVDEAMTYTGLMVSLFPDPISAPFKSNPQATRDLFGAREILHRKLLDQARSQT